MTNRITPSQVIEAYKATGLEPINRGFGDGENCGCPLTALWKHSGCSGFLSPLSWSKDKHGREYSLDFVRGVDHGRSAREDALTQSEYGFDDGCAVWAAVTKWRNERQAKHA